MPGCAVFFLEKTIKTQKVYVAQKRKHTDSDFVINNDENNNGHILRYSSNMHTERQLAIVALEDAIIKNSLEIFKKKSKPKFFPLMYGAKVPLSNLPFSKQKYDIKGILYIYTEFAPCRNKSGDNADYPCIKYYESLANKFPNVQFNIYFKNFTNNTADSIKDKCLDPQALLTEIIRLISSKKITKGFQLECLLKIGNERVLMTNISDLPQNLIDTQWEEIGDRNKAYNFIIKRLLNPFLQLSATTIEEKTNVFNNLYKNKSTPKNIYYKCI